MAIRNRAGERYGKLTIVELANKKPQKWLCRCDCGGMKVARISSLSAGFTKSCGCNRSLAITIDIAGKSFGRWAVVARDSQNSSGEHIWKCVCQCGSEGRVLGSVLRAGKSKSCGCYARERTAQTQSRDISGQRFGLLTAIEFCGKKYRGCRLWRCLCDCGNETEAAASHLIQGVRISCGCAKKTRSGIRRPEGVRRSRLHLQGKRRVRQMKAPGTHTEQQITEMFFKQKGKCGNCFKRIQKDTMHRDHVEPLSKGGSNDISNIQLLCASCNVRKNSFDPLEFARREGRLL